MHGFSHRGVIGRVPFGVGVTTAAIVFWLGIRGSEAALPWLAEVLAPRGINAGLALNLIWLALGAALMWSLMALTARRLRDRGRSPWLAVAAVLPLGVLALVNDAIFLVSKSFVLPALVNRALLIGCGAVALFVLVDCLRERSPD